LEPGKQPVTPTTFANILKSLVLLTQGKRSCEIVATYQNGISCLAHILAVSEDDIAIKYTLHILVNVASHPEYRNILSGIMLQGSLPYLLKHLTSNTTAVQAGALELLTCIKIN
jgi:hypothetical protein